MSLMYGGLDNTAIAPSPPVLQHCRDEAGIPHYLNTHYWWAYVHPKGVKVFERGWLVNLILWGNYARLRDAALAELGNRLPGKTLQVACVYGDLTCRLSERSRAGGGALDVVDVLPIQLSNLRRKLPPDAPVRLLRMDSIDLSLPCGDYDRALIFFLLHEQPSQDRERTLREVFRVVRAGGRSSSSIMRCHTGGIPCVTSGGRCWRALSLSPSTSGGARSRIGYPPPRPKTYARSPSSADCIRRSL